MGTRQCQLSAKMRLLRVMVCQEKDPRQRKSKCENVFVVKLYWVWWILQLCEPCLALYKWKLVSWTLHKDIASSPNRKFPTKERLIDRLIWFIVYLFVSTVLMAQLWDACILSVAVLHKNPLINLHSAELHFLLLSTYWSDNQVIKHVFVIQDFMSPGS